MRICLLSILFPLICSAQISTQQVQQLNDLLIGFSGRNPGIAVSIVSDSGTIYEYYAGFENLGNNSIITKNSEFNLASLTKQTVALSYLNLFGFKAIDTLQLKHVTLKYPQFSEIKISDLLNHCSGIREFHTIRQLEGVNSSKVITEAEVESYLKAWTQLSYPSGQQHSYSNANYYILSQALKDYLSNKSPTDYVLFKMHSGLDQMHYDQKRCEHPAYGHSGNLNFEMFKAKETIPGYSNLFSSSANFSKWLNYLLHSEEILNAIRRPYYLKNEEKTRVPYQIGFIQSIYEQDSVIEHGGNAKGYQTFMRIIPSKKIAISVLMNSDVFGADYYVNRIHNIINNKEMVWPNNMAGKIVDENGKEIPFVEMYVDRNSGPGLSNDTACFYYHVRPDVDTVIFNAQQYQRKHIDIDKFDRFKIIGLDKTSKNENPLFESHHRNPMINHVPKSYYSMAPWVNTAGAVIVNKFGTDGVLTRLDSVSAFITKEAKAKTPFRFVVYRANPETRWPEQYPLFLSKPVQALNGNEWVALDLTKNDIQLLGEYFVGIQWLYPNMNNGKHAQYLGFNVDKNTDVSYYRSPFDKWRRVGELMYRGNRDMMINVAESISKSTNYSSPTVIKQFYLYDNQYETYYPSTFAHNTLFIEPYPRARELRFEQDLSNSWKHESQDWIFKAEFDEEGEYEFTDYLPGRIQQKYEVLEYNLENGDKPWVSKSYAQNNVKLTHKESGTTWKIKIKKDVLRVKLKCGRFMSLRHFHNDLFFLEGDASFGRTLKVITDDENKITAVQYSDSRNFRILFEAN